MEEQEPRKESPETSLREFEQTLKRATPGVILTPVIMILNLAVFVSLLASGAGFWNADTESLVAGGANFGPLTLPSDRWRLLTYMFVHGGFVHLLINLVVFGWVGSLMERLLGRLGFFCLYLLSGIAGGLASLSLESFSRQRRGFRGHLRGVWGIVGGPLAEEGGLSPRIPFRAFMEFPDFFRV